MAKNSILPKATRVLEHVAFFNIQINTNEGAGYVFMAVDAFSQYAISIGVEGDESDQTILKNIYLLTEHPDFTNKMGKGFTLVLEKHQELESRIIAIISTVNGKLMFNKTYNNLISLPVLKTISKMRVS